MPSDAEVMPSATPTTGLTTRPTAPCATPVANPRTPPRCAPSIGLEMTPARPRNSPPATPSPAFSNPSPTLRGGAAAPPPAAERERRSRYLSGVRMGSLVAAAAGAGIGGNGGARGGQEAGKPVAGSSRVGGGVEAGVFHGRSKCGRLRHGTRAAHSLSIESSATPFASEPVILPIESVTPTTTLSTSDFPPRSTPCANSSGPRTRPAIGS